MWMNRKYCVCSSSYGIWRMIKFLLNSRLREKEAYSLCEKKNSRMTSNNALLNEYLESHWLDVDCCGRDDFNKHIILRAKRLLNAIEVAMGKNISGRDSEEVLNSFGEILI